MKFGHWERGTASAGALTLTNGAGAAARGALTLGDGGAASQEHGLDGVVAALFPGASACCREENCEWHDWFLRPVRMIACLFAVFILFFSFPGTEEIRRNRTPLV